MGKVNQKLDSIVAEARKAHDQREQGYLQRALKIYPHVCGLCTRNFERESLHELTVHHRNHNHNDNPEDGSNWELLCVYCHDNEHQRQLEAVHESSRIETSQAEVGTHSPFVGLRAMLSEKE